MSVWRRVRSWLLGEARAGEAAAQAPEAERPVAGSSAPPPSSPRPSVEPAAEDALAAMAARRGEVDEDRALAHLEAMAAEGREGRALELARRVLEGRPEASRLGLRVAERLTARGQLEAAEHVLAPWLAEPTVAPAVAMLAGELAERRGAPDRALARYEQVLAHDVGYPGAWERVRRLRETREPGAQLAGATLLADGALARGRYRVEGELGRGGAGTVFLARDLQLDRRVALKVYHRRGRAARERLQGEARTPARLEHPGVIRVLDVDERLGAIVMEHVRGGALRDALRAGPLDLDRAVELLDSALEALAFVHARGWVHRDLKPSNLLLRREGGVVLTDFGLAARAGEAPPLRGGEGTLAYMPPEQRAGAPAAPAADVHAFGATMAELLEGSRPAAPPRLRELAAACTREDPAARPQVAEVRAALGVKSDS